MNTVPTKPLDLRVGQIIALDPHNPTCTVDWPVIAIPVVVETGAQAGDVLVPISEGRDGGLRLLVVASDVEVQVLPPEVAERAARLADARALLDRLEAAGVPIGALSMHYFPRRGSLDDQVAEVDRIAELLGVTPVHDVHYEAEIKIGQAEYGAVVCNVPARADQGERAEPEREAGR